MDNYTSELRANELGTDQIRSLFFLNFFCNCSVLFSTAHPIDFENQGKKSKNDSQKGDFLGKK
jgi:hypothetical protein